MRPTNPGRIGLWLLALVTFLLGGMHPAALAQAVPAEAAAASAPSAFDAARAQLDARETLKSLSSEGQLLYQREKVKLSGYQYCSQAVAQAERGDFRDSLQSAAKALHIGQMQGNDDLIAVSKRDLAIAYSYAGDLDSAQRYAEQALTHRAKNPAVVAGPAYKTLGDVAVRRGALDEAIAFYGQAAAASSERFKPLVQISLANAYVAKKDAAKARALYDSLPPLQGTLVPLYHRGLGNLLLIENRPADALASFEAAVRSASGTDAGYHRLWALEGSARALLALGDKAAARDRYVEAAQLSDNIRARFRSEEFKTGLFGNVQQIFERAIAMLAEAGDDAQAWSLSESSRARALLDVLRDRDKSPTGPSDDVLEAAEVAKLPEVTAMLRANETLVEFHSLDDRVLVWTITSSGLKGASLAVPRAELKTMIEAFRALVRSRQLGANDASTALYDRLLAPLALPAGKALVIVPHGDMHYLPFQALRSPEGFLIERHPVAVEPSASVAVQLRRRTAQTAGRLVAFGNPINVGRLDLPAAEREVQSISQMFPERQLYFHENASKSRFRESAGSGRILHVAAHAELDPIDALQSSILLAAESDDLGLMHAREVYGLNLTGVSLVTLSACSSGLGRIVGGDDIVGFTRSFLSAGASSLLVSLWPVDDASTQLLMSTFYAQLTNGVEAIDALRAAQLAVLSRPRFAHPYYWAPFDLIGDWRLQIRK